MTQTAANLIVEPLQARTHEELHTLDKLNELVKKHNLLVRHIFNSKDDPVRWVDNTFDVPTELVDKSFVGQDYHCDRYRRVGTSFVCQSCITPNDCTTNYRCKLGAFPPNIEPSLLTELKIATLWSLSMESARGLRNIFKIWKITCNCALPYSDTNALIPVCSDCKRPLPNQED